MGLSSFAHDTVTVIRAPLVSDEYGTPGAKRDWTNAVETTVDGCNVQYDAGGQVIDGRNAVTTRTVLRLPEGSGLLATDRIRWNGDTYEVNGEVAVWKSASGALDHEQASLTRVRG